MSLLLAIESSSNVYRVVLGRDGKSIFDSDGESCETSFRTLGNLLSCGLEMVGSRPEELSAIAINNGPGSLTFVRAGISFANALAFSLGVAIYPFNWFEIMASQTREVTLLPVLCAVPAANENAYVGLVTGPFIETMRFGSLSTVVAQLAQGFSEVAVAGRIRHRLSSLLTSVKVVDTGIDNPDAQVLLKLGYQASQTTENSTKQVEALNDQSSLFYEWP